MTLLFSTPRPPAGGSSVTDGGAGPGISRPLVSSPLLAPARGLEHLTSSAAAAVPSAPRKAGAGGLYRGVVGAGVREGDVACPLLRNNFTARNTAPLPH